MIGAAIKSMFEEEARERQRGGQGGVLLKANLPEANSTGQSRDEAARVVNVSPRSVESASKVLRTGAEELQDSVRGGRVSVSAAADIAELPKEEQKEVVARGEKEIMQIHKKNPKSNLNI